MGLFRKCDSCGHTVFSGQTRTVNEIEMYLCSNCVRIIVNSALSEHRIRNAKTNKELESINNPPPPREERSY